MSHGYENLIPASQRSKEEVKKMASNGGKKSGETRRRKRDQKKLLSYLLELKASDEDKELLLSMGFYNDKLCNDSVLLASLFVQAKSGSIQAFQKIQEIMGEDIKSKELEEKIRHNKEDERIREKALEKEKEDKESEENLLKSLLLQSGSDIDGLDK